MKKQLLLIFVGLFLFNIQTQSQITAGVQARLAGYKLSEPAREFLTSFKPGFEFGAFVKMPVASIFYFQPELGFTYIAGKIKPENDHNIDYKCAAFSIPLLFGVNIVETSDANFRAYLGLGNTIPIFNSINVMNDALKEYAPDIPLTHKISSSAYEISGIIGVGFDMMDISIDLRYGRTFNYTIKRDDDKFFQNTFSLAIGYKMIRP